MSSVNKVILVGNVGNDPEVRAMQSGDSVVNLSIATSEKWKDKSTGEQKEKKEWHRVVSFNQGLNKVIQSYVNKGSKIYIEGQLETRKWTDNNGIEKYTTEIVLRPYRGELVLLDSRGQERRPSGNYDAPLIDENGTEHPATSANQDLEGEIPF